jgi:tripartite-type tricarboxylate transporter receptor subunit TctC
VLAAADKFNKGIEMRLIKIFFVLYAAVFATTGTLANQPGNKPVQIVVPFGPGGTASVLGLSVAEMLSANNIPAVVVNKPGADSMIGANFAAKSAPDGKTLFLATTSSVVANVVFKPQGIEYDEQSFTPVISLGTTGMVLITPASSVFKNYEQFKFYVKANPEKFNIGTFNSNLAKIWSDWAEREGLPPPNIIMYKGSSQMLTDVAGGHLLLAIDIWTSTIPFVKSDKIKVVATLDNTIQSHVKKLSPSTGSVNLSYEKMVGISISNSGQKF